MKKIKDYTSCFCGGVCSGIGCFYFAEELLLSFRYNLIMQFFCIIIALALIYGGCLFALPKDSSRLGAEKFLIFSLGVIFTGILI